MNLLKMLICYAVTIMVSALLAKEPSIKFCAISDLHYGFPIPDFNHSERVRDIISAVQQEQCEFIVSGGDFACTSEMQTAVELFKNSGISIYHTLGNHDTDVLTHPKVTSIYGMPGDYYAVDIKGIRFVFLNTNYFRDQNGKFHVTDRNNMRNFPGAERALPPEQMEWFKQTVRTSPFPCIIVSHHMYLHRLQSQAEEINSLIREVRHSPGRVVLWIGGDEHIDEFKIQEGCGLLILNSTSYYWTNQTHNLFGKNIHQNYELAGNLLIYNTPLYAIISVDSDGTVTIEGRKSSWYKEVSPMKAGLTKDLFRSGEAFQHSVIPEVRNRYYHTFPKSEKFINE